MASTVSVNATAASSPSSLQALQPIIDAIDNAVNALLVNAVFCSFLIPIAIALLLSNSGRWKTPVVVMNLCAIALGLAFGITAIYLSKRIIVLNPVGPSFFLTTECLSFSVPICTQSILLFRVIAVYPPRDLSWPRRVLIYGTFATIQTGRLINATIGIFKTGQLMGTTDFTVVEQVVWTQPYIKVEFGLQLVYDSLASSLFLLRLYKGGALRTKSVGYPSMFTNGKPSTYASRLRGLFWIAVFNFIFPVMLNITVIILLFRDPNPNHGAFVMAVNVYVEIISVLLATVWCSKEHWQNTSVYGPGGPAPAPVPGEVVLQSLSAAAFASPSIYTSHTQFDGDMAKLTI